MNRSECLEIYTWTKAYLCEVVASQLFKRAMHIQVLSSIADTGLV